MLNLFAFDMQLQPQFKTLKHSCFRTSQTETVKGQTGTPVVNVGLINRQTLARNENPDCLPLSVITGPHGSEMSHNFKKEMSLNISNKGLDRDCALQETFPLLSMYIHVTYWLKQGRCNADFPALLSSSVIIAVSRFQGDKQAQSTFIK